MKSVRTRRFALVAFISLCFACSTDEPTPPRAISVMLAPDSATIYAGQSVQFIATVHNSTNQAVNWSLSGAGCSGTTCGTIDSTGLYTAPLNVPSPSMTVTVRAISVADNTKSASATVTILERIVSIALAPDSAHVYVGESVKFAAIVQNATNDAVDWSLSGAGCSGAACGTINSTGLYTAPSNVPNPAVVTVDAVLVADNTKSASATITILEPVFEEWAWLSGSDSPSTPGVYGTRGIASPTNVPVSRENAVSWIDGSGGLWLFGGASSWPYHQGYYNDLWTYNTATREWTWVSGSDSVDQRGSYGTQGVSSPSNVPGARQSAVSWIDPSGNLWLYGGFGYDAAGNYGELSDLWRFVPAAGEWTWVAGNYGLYWSGFYGTKGVPDPSNKPGARAEAVTWADPAGSLWLFGGRGYDSAGHSGWLNDLWRFDLATLEWTWVSGSETRDQAGSYGTLGMAYPSNVPGARLGPVTWIDAQGRLWLFGGIGYDSANNAGALNDLWRFDPIALEWTWISGSNIRDQAGIYGTMGIADPSNVPGGRSAALSWYDSGGKLWLFGGLGRDSAIHGDTSLNDLWCFDPATLEWTWVSGNSSGNQGGVYGTKGMAEPSNVPGARTDAVSWVDPLGSLWLFGGYGFTQFAVLGQLNDLWKYIK
jgi:hypothetical protein